MNLLWIEREMPVAAARAWSLLTDVERWPEWGPSVRAAGLDGELLEAGATGWVRTPFGIRVRFEVTDFDDGHRWSWKVAGVPATDHRVRPLSPTTCVVGFGVPRLAAPYAIVCRRALATIHRLLTS
jgi:hypothetical protein